VDLRYEAASNNTGRINPGKTSSAITGQPDIPCFLLLDDPADELLLSLGLGTHRINPRLADLLTRVMGN
jgi:hypothetical protein